MSLFQSIRATGFALCVSGATLEGDYLQMPDGDLLVMLRAPWGIAVQLAKRFTSMV